MEAANERKPRVLFEFQVEKIIDVSSNGEYKVQWAPTWVSKFHLDGCEHLIQEFLQQQTHEIKVEEFLQQQTHEIKVEARFSDTEGTSEVNNNSDYRCVELQSESRQVISIKEPTLYDQLSHRLSELLTSPENHGVLDGNETNGSTSPSLVHSISDIQLDKQESEFQNTDSSVLSKKDKEATKTNPFSESELACTEPHDWQCSLLQTKREEEDTRPRNTLKEVPTPNDLCQKRHPKYEYMAGGPSAGFDYAGKCREFSINIEPCHLAESTRILDKMKITWLSPQHSVSGNDVVDQSISSNSVMEIACVRDKSMCCATCKRSFPTKRHLFTHMRNDHNMKPYPCPNCSEAFSYYAKLTKHLSQSCSSRGPGGAYACNYCSKSFTRPGRLQEHLDVHRGESLYFCNICKKSFASKQSFKQHMDTHNNESKFKCTDCERSFRSITNLRAHMTDHTGILPYVCKQCSKGFKRAVDLKAHLQDHSGEFAHQCPHCPKAFKRLSGLKDHLNIHSDERPYPCTQCDKQFRSNANLRVHLRTHSGVKPYTCLQCLTSFTQLDHLKRHAKIHTKEKPVHSGVNVG